MNTTHMNTTHMDTIQEPFFNPDEDYSQIQHLQIALAKHAIQKQQYTSGDHNQPPNVAVLARLYGVKEATLRGHIKNPNRMTQAEQHRKQQLLTTEEEHELVQRALFMDDFNVPPEKETFELLALELLQQRKPGYKSLGIHWINRFLKRHKDECKFVFAHQIAQNRANADCWEINNNFFEKVNPL